MGPADGGEVVIGDALSIFFVIVISWCDTLLPLAAATVDTKHSAINPKVKHLVMKVSLRYCRGRRHWWDYHLDNDVVLRFASCRETDESRAHKSKFVRDMVDGHPAIAKRAVLAPVLNRPVAPPAGWLPGADIPHHNSCLPVVRSSGSGLHKSRRRFVDGLTPGFSWLSDVRRD